MPHKTHHIQSMCYQSNQWMLSNVSGWWQNVVTMMYSLQWGIASYHLAVRYCSLQGLLGQKTEGIVLPGVAHSTTSVSTVWHPAIVKHVCLSLFAWVVTNQWATKNSSTLTLHPGYALWDIPLFFQIEAKYLTCREQLQAKQLRQWLRLMKIPYMLCYAQVDWYKNTSHKNCRQTRCSVVHNLGPALFIFMWKNIHVLYCSFFLISREC